MTMTPYGDWEENPRGERLEYAAGKITAERFLHRIDTTHVLESYDMVKQRWHVKAHQPHIHHDGDFQK